MVRTEKRVRELVSEDPTMREVVETVLDRADDGEVTWADVKGEIESGQWGRLIEKEVLVEGEAGFRIEDPEAAREGLKGEDGDLTSSSVDLDEVEGTTWSKWDKMAGAGTLLFFVGYMYNPIRNAVGTTIDVVLGPLLEVLPFYAVVLLLAMTTGLYSTALRGVLMDMEKMSMYQDRMKDIQERRKEAKERGDDAAMQEIQEEQMEAMGDQLGMFKEQFRPMAWIMFLTIPAFLWMYWAIGARGAESHHVLGEVVFPIWGAMGWTEPMLGPIQPWIFWYFICSTASIQIIQKALDIEMSPSS
ncbi:DUF106 domain-containing protein [Halolamina salifodinae]|uniref:Uncharacterized membrane protein (DUF106 family) n=1 Tax=Halolamina salifodinae TaxID=1202767 RepID=A0A8T4GRN4_9EURY|nr:DUF106 domain-containing protein [Halolamina salifodinae]MBP1985801.1 uncharacterized membrane protein (DUF106 family) [Halolamina salifodinae]